MPEPVMTGVGAAWSTAGVRPGTSRASSCSTDVANASLAAMQRTREVRSAESQPRVAKADRQDKPAQ
jgi:Zn-dependent alcohol dehydrogenase